MIRYKVFHIIMINSLNELAVIFIVEWEEEKKFKYMQLLQFVIRKKESEKFF